VGIPTGERPKGLGREHVRVSMAIRSRNPAPLKISMNIDEKTSSGPFEDINLIEFSKPSFSVSPQPDT
jgi:hypothetical protein